MARSAGKKVKRPAETAGQAFGLSLFLQQKDGSGCLSGAYQATRRYASGRQVGQSTHLSPKPRAASLPLDRLFGKFTEFGRALALDQGPTSPNF
jgi:hypothetical protein